MMIGTEILRRKHWVKTMRSLTCVGRAVFMAKLEAGCSHRLVHIPSLLAAGRFRFPKPVVDWLASGMSSQKKKDPPGLYARPPDPVTWSQVQWVWC